MKAIENRIKAIGRRIKNRCKALSISGKELSERAGLSQDYISEIEGGKRVLSFWALNKISRVLKTYPEELLTGKKACPT